MKIEELKSVLKVNFLTKLNTINGRKLKKEFKNKTNLSIELINNTLFCPSDCPETIRAKFIFNNITEFPKCKNCGQNTKWSNQAPKTLDYCSVKCASSHDLTRNKVKKTNLKKFGVEQIMQSDVFKKQYKNTCLEKYGVDNISKLDSVKEKKIKTNLKNWGVENVSKNKEIQQRKIKSNLEKLGCEYPIQNLTIKEKTKKTNNNKYDVDYTLQSNVVKEKSKTTNKQRYGVEYSMQNKEIKQKAIKTIKEKDDIWKQNVKDKRKSTCVKKYGVEYPSQNESVFLKQQRSSAQIHLYKNTSFKYQGSYEFLFLKLMDEKGFLPEISVPKTVNYTLNNNMHVYFPDFQFRGQIIEIKSTWTYNKNGKDKLLEDENESKWSAVRDSGEKLIVLMSKEEIKKFVDSII